MKTILVVLLVCLVALPAFADVDPTADLFGIFFDRLDGHAVTWVSPFTPFDVYLLLMNPLGVTDGYECTVTASGAPYYILQTSLPVDSLDIDPAVNGFAVGAATPFVVDNGAMLLCTWQFMVLDARETRFFITQATIPSMPGDLPVVTGNGVLRRCGVTSGDVGMAVATVNPPPDPMEVSTFGAVKSLFR